MMCDDNDRPLPSPTTDILVAVAIAAGSSLAVGLVEWALDALRGRKEKTDGVP